jgi:CRISPR-associated exonuclease Cas4
LIHLEGQWSDNRLTAEGIVMHERAHDEESESRGDFRISRSLRLRSLRLGLVGQADVVEFHKTLSPTEGVELNGSPGWWQPLIIEYKHGKPKIGHEDEVQLCAQALCLEEMLKTKLTAAAFFYGRPRRRQDLVIDEALRQETESLVTQMHSLFAAGITPDPVYAPRCHSCSLESVCLPKLAKRQTSVKDYIRQQTREAEYNS